MFDLTKDERGAARLFGLREGFVPLINVFLPTFKVTGGKIVSLTGDSGCGKTLFLEMLENSATNRVCNLNNVEFDAGKSAFQNLFDKLKSTEKVLKILGKIGLAEAGLILRSVKTYSAGELFRFKLALAIANGAETLIIDEFGMQLDDILACNIAFSLRKVADCEGVTIFLASCRDVYLRDLQPDISFRLDESGVRICKRHYRRRKVSYSRRLSVERADTKTWKRFAHWHYKSHRTGPTSDVFTLNFDGKRVGIVVYGYPSIFSSPRNLATDGKFNSNVQGFVQKLNSEMRVIRRVVMLPKFRGVGLAADLVRKSLALLPSNINYVECLTSMSEYCGFLQNAGFDFVKKTDVPRIVKKFNAELRQNGFNDENMSAERFLIWLNSLPDDNQKNMRKTLKQVVKMRIQLNHPGLRNKDLSQIEQTDRFLLLIEEVLAVRYTRPSYFIKDLRR